MVARALQTTNCNQSCCCKNLYLKYVRSCCNAAAKSVQQDGSNVDLILVIPISFVLRLWFYYMWQSTECCESQIMRMRCKEGHLLISYYYKRCNISVSIVYL